VAGAETISQAAKNNSIIQVDCVAIAVTFPASYTEGTMIL
jgi:hypothetical protein